MPKALEPDLARLYHLNSSNVRCMAPDLELDESRRPAKRRLDPGAERIPLPGRDFDLSVSLGATLATRRSRRDLQLSPLPLDILGRLLFMSFGIASWREAAGTLVLERPFPSGGALYPLELYVVAQEVTDLPDGVYHYDPWTHELARRRSGRFHEQLAGMAFGQDVIRHANLVICLTAIFERTTWKYGQRGYRYVLFEAGHVNHNLYLIATALGLAGFAVGGFFDQEVSGLLDLQSGEEDPLYLFCAGQGGS
ncbi:MAG TPA: SagB/ThcOx family dehydrogenase [Thermoanaerobaculia bacterium]|nr:SagB/ThcOx family dehydrogenase [Thermoanaerobaculia bacterium]